MPAKSKAQQRFMGMVHQCKKGGNCSSDEVKKVAKTKHNNLPNKVTEKMTFKDFLVEGYKVLPSIDKDRYREREGLEGTFRARNGKVYYYDPQAGKNYDPDTDFYISQRISL